MSSGDFWAALGVVATALGVVFRFVLKAFKSSLQEDWRADIKSSIDEYEKRVYDKLEETEEAAKEDRQEIKDMLMKTQEIIANMQVGLSQQAAYASGIERDIKRIDARLDGQ